MVTILRTTLNVYSGRVRIALKNDCRWLTLTAPLFPFVRRDAITVDEEHPGKAESPIEIAFYLRTNLWVITHPVFDVPSGTSGEYVFDLATPSALLLLHDSEEGRCRGRTGDCDDGIEEVTTGLCCWEHGLNSLADFFAQDIEVWAVSLDRDFGGI